MHFELPLAFLGLVLLVPVLALLRLAEKRSRNTAAVFYARLPERAYFLARQILAGVFVVSLIVIAARPFITYQTSASFLLVVDVSRSMQARHSCSEPTFLDRAKTVMLDVIEAIPESDIGIVAFDRFAFPVSPVTADRAYLRDVIEHGVYTGLMLEATQTEIANALSVVAAKRQRLPEVFGDVSHVVLLSDGNVGGNFRRRLGVPLAELRDTGIRVSTVGIGNPDATPIADSENGQCVNRLVEMNGERVLIPLRADILQFIATETGARYYSELDTAGLAQSLRAELRQQSVADSTSPHTRRDVTSVFLIVATLALMGFVYLPLFVRLR